jgi:hypothetical protein
VLNTDENYHSICLFNNVIVLRNKRIRSAHRYSLEYSYGEKIISIYNTSAKVLCLLQTPISYIMHNIVLCCINIIIYHTSCKNILISLDNRHLTFLNSCCWCRNQIVITPSAIITPSTISPSQAELCRTVK